MSKEESKLDCPGSVDGKHVVGLDSLVLVPGEWIVDVTCSVCGCGGSIPIDPSEVNW